MSRPVTPASGAYGNMSAHPDESVSGRPAHTASKRTSYLSSGPAGTSGFDHSEGQPIESSVIAQNSAMHDVGIESTPQEPSHQDVPPVLDRSDSRMSQSQTYTPSRGGTLKKKASLKRVGSVGRSASKRSSYAGSVRSLKLGDGEKEKKADSVENNSAFFCPVPTSGNPTELLANRFQAWRKVLKDLINYFRELSRGYDMRSKAIQTVSTGVNAASMPSNFVAAGGLGDALTIIRDFHKQSFSEATKARDVENEIVLQLTGLRSDLQQKIKEIKSLSGDFKNSVDKELEGTKRAVRSYQDSIGMVDHDAAATSGKGDPFIVKLGVDRQIEKQLEEENYLHRAYLNLENSGRELESIVVGEIQKAYNAYAGILRREADEAYETSEKLKVGPLAMAKDHEWDNFTQHNSQMIDPRLPVRTLNSITYPGKDHPAAIEVRSGMLERKSKYLKNYTPGWYILSPTHLHEFKSADRIASQSPIMSLYLNEQKLGNHSDPGSSSHKFMLKGRQTGSMHRGHAWVFRAESHDTMMAWFGDIKELTEKTGEARNDFVRRTHARSLSGNSLKPSSITSGNSNDGMEEDEADHVPYSSEQSVRGQSIPREAGEISAGAGVGGGLLGATAMNEMDDNRSEAGWRPPQRPSPGGRFPSDVNVSRGLQAPHSPSSDEIMDTITDQDRETMMAAGALPGSGVPFSNSARHHTELQSPVAGNEETGVARDASPYRAHNATTTSHPMAMPPPMTPTKQQTPAYASGYQHADFRHGASPVSAVAHPVDETSNYGDWMAPMAGGAVGGAALGAAALGAAGAKWHEHRQTAEQRQQELDQQQVANSDGMMAPAPISKEPNRPIESIDNVQRQMDDSSAVPAHGTSSAPIPVETVPEPVPMMGDVEQHEEQERSLSRPRGVTQSTQATSGTGLTASTMAPASSVGGTSLSTVPTSVDGGMGNGIGNGNAFGNEAIYEKNEVMPTAHGSYGVVSGADVFGSSTTAGAGELADESEIQDGGLAGRSAMDGDTVTAADFRHGGISTAATTATDGGSAVGNDTSFAGANMAERPKPFSAHSVTTISDLHMPGEYPRTVTTTATGF